MNSSQIDVAEKIVKKRVKCSQHGPHPTASTKPNPSSDSKNPLITEFESYIIKEKKLKKRFAKKL